MTTDLRDSLQHALAEHYRIERELGQGGMATVYLAHDRKHERLVAIKVLRPELAAVIGAERFAREIKTIAALQHPHILGLIDSGEVRGTAYYVMPYVEGESLRDRLRREKQLPVPEAIRIASEVASALDYAHRHGVIHRDIKPENILLHDGQALVADFGIALAVSQAGGLRVTETGLSLGTPTYMSPEQAMGEREITGRSDIYSLGCVVYEMLTGEPPFTGPTAQAIVAKVITEKPADIRRARSTVPEAVDEAVMIALAKLPADRFGTAAEFARALEGGLTSGATRAARPAERAAAARAPRWRTGALAGTVVVLGALAAWGWLRPVPEPPVRRSIVMLDDFPYDIGGNGVPAISPDGSRILYTGRYNNVLMLEQDQLHPKLVSGATHAAAAFFSPDGRTIGEVTGFPGDLVIVPAEGGAAQTLVSDSVSGWGASWGDDGWIYYITNDGGTLRRIRPGGSAQELVAQADSSRDELMLQWPSVLPGSRGVLVTVQRRKGPPAIGAIDMRSHRMTILVQGVYAAYAPSGHLVYVQGNGDLMAVRFDARRFTLLGRPVKVSDGIALSWGTAVMTLGADGTLFYARYAPRYDVVRVSRDGREQPVDSGWTGNFDAVTLSPRGDRLAVGVLTGTDLEVWVKELNGGAFTRVASGGTLNYRPAWSPDGLSLLFPSDRLGMREQLFTVPADGSAPPRPLLRASRSIDEALWSKDGRWLIYRIGSGIARDIYAMRPGVDSAPGLALAASDAEEYSPALSPDAHWLAYVSEESGRSEVYVRPFPEVGAARVEVSRDGGTEPQWAHSGRELFYRNGAGQLVAAQLGPDAPRRVISQRVLFDASNYGTDVNHVAYAVAPDDQAFYFPRRLPGPPPQLVLVRNWFHELRAQTAP